MHTALQWIGSGLREALAMVWLTWWPLIFGFALSGVVQSLVPRNRLRHSLGEDSLASATRASVLGVLSSSCSYAASSMSRALFGRGASWTNSLVFMIASTNLVIELGVVLYRLLGWPFVVAQLVGGVLMIGLLVMLTPLFFSTSLIADIRQHLNFSTEDESAENSGTPAWKDRERYVMAARYSVGDLTMLRRELLAGFIVAGFISVHVSGSWWSHLFLSGHGMWTAVENAAIAPLLAVISFVCSVGNIPLAAALWVHHVAFGGVVAFIFADLVTLPLLAIYRRFYGTKVAVRMFLLLWFVMSVGGVLVDALFTWWHAVPRTSTSDALFTSFPLGTTLVLNVMATLVLLILLVVARRGRRRDAGASDPICGMTVDRSAPAATRQDRGRTVYFCSVRCAERFDLRNLDRDQDEGRDTLTPTAPDARSLDPVCQMWVDPTTATSAEGPDGSLVYFCCDGCRNTFLEEHRTS